MVFRTGRVHRRRCRGRIVRAQLHRADGQHPQGLHRTQPAFILPELREAVRIVGRRGFLQEVHGTHEHHPKRYSNWPTMPQYEFLADSLWPQFAYGRNAVYPMAIR